MPGSGERRVPNRSSKTPAAPRPVTELLEELAGIDDAEALLAWALAMLPLRNGFDETARAKLDAAFLARAEALGAESEVLFPSGSHGLGVFDPSNPQRGRCGASFPLIDVSVAPFRAASGPRSCSGRVGAALIVARD